FGNLFLAALTDVTGDFVEAVRLSTEVLASKGRLYPATLNDVRLVAELEDGTEVHGETNITASRAPIRRLRLEPEHCLPLPEALTAIRNADIITVGPGSLYTSILPNLLVARVAESIGASKAVKIFICNLMTQPGETDGYTARRHLETVKKYAPEIHFDYTVVNDRPITDEQAARYAAEGAQQIGMTDHLLEETFGAETEIVRADLLDEGEKVRHSPEKLARVIVACYEHAFDERPAAATLATVS
ncbi:MAG: gluconeogenesis factor YvcK family protein, partial [Pyrinomonadaceae bacterium]